MQVNPVEIDAGAARRYAELGVDRLLVYPLPLENPAEVGAFPGKARRPLIPVLPLRMTSSRIALCRS
jgi:hypothetical protein